MNNPLNFFKYAKKEGWKKAIEQLKYNYVMQETIEWQTKKLIFGYSTTILGLVGLLIYFVVIRPKAYIFYFLICGGFLLVTYTQLKAQLKAKKMIQDIKKLDYQEEEE